VSEKIEFLFRSEKNKEKPRGPAQQRWQSQRAEKYGNENEGSAPPKQAIPGCYQRNQKRVMGTNSFDDELQSIANVFLRLLRGTTEPIHRIQEIGTVPASEKKREILQPCSCRRVVAGRSQTGRRYSVHSVFISRKQSLQSDGRVVFLGKFEQPTLVVFLHAKEEIHPPLEYE